MKNLSEEINFKVRDKFKLAIGSLVCLQILDKVWQRDWGNVWWGVRLAVRRPTHAKLKDQLK